MIYDDKNVKIRELNGGNKIKIKIALRLLISLRKNAVMIRDKNL